MPRQINYPFVPKSTASMRPGQFWQIPLSNGCFACGRVLQLPGPKAANSSGERSRNGECQAAGSRTMFYAGLMSWCGDQLPTAESIARHSLLDQGSVHLRTILRNGGEILGCRPLELDGIEPRLEVEGSKLMQGFRVVRDATPEEQQSLYVASTWGYCFIVALAERHFVKKNPWSDRLP